jgi:hypothetical protein
LTYLLDSAVRESQGDGGLADGTIAEENHLALELLGLLVTRVGLHALDEGRGGHGTR